MLPHGPHSKNSKHKNTSPQHLTTKWVIITYYGRETKEITELFKEANIKITFQTKKHGTKPNKALPTTRQVLTKWHISSEMYGFPTKIHRANRSNI
jgi:hypothetical protein